MKTIPFLILSFIWLLLSCDKASTDNTPGNSDLVIKAGYICGWGAGVDSISITQTTIKFESYVPSMPSNPHIKKTRPVTGKEWNEIVNDLDVENFVKLHYQSCNVCVDGCDEWISVDSGGIHHKITFDYGQKIDTISKLQTKLAQLRAEFAE